MNVATAGAAAQSGHDKRLDVTPLQIGESSSAAGRKHFKPQPTTSHVDGRDLAHSAELLKTNQEISAPSGLVQKYLDWKKLGQVRITCRKGKT